MTSQKTLLTYKRKRFSTQDDHVHAVKEANASSNSLIRGVSLGRSQPKALDSNSENMNEDSLNDPQKELQYPSSEVQDSEEQVQEKKRTKRNESVKTYKLGPMKLRSQKELSSRKVAKKGSRKTSPSSAYARVSKTAGSPLIDISSTNVGSSLKATEVEGSSRSVLPNEDGIKSSPICLESSAENKLCSGCSDSISRIINSDNMLLSKEPPKENYTPPLITFYRRVRKKQIISEAPAETNLKVGGNQGSSVNLSKHALEASPEHDKSSRKSIFKDQPITATVSEHADITKLHGLQHDVMANADKDLTFDSALARGFPETKIAGDKLGGSSFHHAKGSNSNCVEYNHEEPSNTFVAAPTKKAPGNPILMHEDRQYFPATDDIDSRGELRSNLSGAVDISGIMITPHIVPENRCQTSDLNLSATACPNNDNSNKPFADVVPENLLESQSSSTPSCAVVDDEVDGRGKELEWLESLDKSLQEAKEKRNTCLVRGQDDNNCGSSSGWPSHLIPTKSPVHSPCNQDQYKDYTRQTTREFLSLSGKPGDEKQRLEHKSNMSSPRSNFIDLALPLNCRVPVGSAKDFQNMHSRLNLGLEEAEGHMRSVQAPWHTLGESSSLCRHKKIVEDVITGTRMLKERQGFFLDKYRRYSLEWSEEELDFLWIGVRRYGIHNWSAMLRDPKLCFSEFRVPEDLARRWDLEQTKMFSSPLTQPVSLPLFSSSPPMDFNSLEKPAGGGYGASSQSYQDFPVTAAETRLSLGDVYLRKGPNLDRSLFHHSSGLGTTNLMSNAGPSTLPFFDSSLIDSSNPIAGIRQKKPTRLRNTRSLWRPYILRRKSLENASPENQPTGLPTSISTIPHWLRQHVNVGTHSSEPRESALTPISTASQSTIPLNNNVPVGVPLPNLAEQSVPLKVARRPGILRRKGMASRNRAAAVRASEVLGSSNEPWTATRLDSLPSLGLASQKPPSADPGPSQSSICDLNKKVPAPNEPTDLVVVDSEPSSEETISDAQGSKN